VSERSEMNTKFRSGNIKGKYHSENPGIDRKVIL
jgi:hypothetical protein